MADGVHAVSNDEKEQHLGKGAFVQVLASQRHDPGKATKMETNEKTEQ